MFTLCLFIGESLMFFSIRHMCDVINCSSRVVNVLGEIIFGNTLGLICAHFFHQEKQCEKCILCFTEIRKSKVWKIFILGLVI